MSTPQALVIEDDRDLSLIFSQAVRAAGFEVEAVSTNHEALTRLADFTPQLVTLDLHLQQAKGVEILYYIRAEPRLAQTNVILTTADSALAETLQDQVDYILIKPISFTQLRDLAARLKTQF
ncbi:Transcriptional regulatory protein WalR [Thermoflexales bacterium]|nr:Transcriptional regulatory protein WalR [Thermoflexales bacterium]